MRKNTNARTSAHDQGEAVGLPCCILYAAAPDNCMRRFPASVKSVYLYYGSVMLLSAFTETFHACCTARDGSAWIASANTSTFWYSISPSGAVFSQSKKGAHSGGVMPPADRIILRMTNTAVLNCVSPFGKQYARKNGSFRNFFVCYQKIQKASPVSFAFVYKIHLRNKKAKPETRKTRFFNRMFGFLTYISDFLPKLWALRLIYAIFLMFSPLLVFLLLFFVCKQCFGKRVRSEKGGEGKWYYIRGSIRGSLSQSRISPCRNTPAARRIQQKARQKPGFFHKPSKAKPCACFFIFHYYLLLPRPQRRFRRRDKN